MKPISPTKSLIFGLKSTFQILRGQNHQNHIKPGGFKNYLKILEVDKNVRKYLFWQSECQKIQKCQIVWN